MGKREARPGKRGRGEAREYRGWGNTGNVFVNRSGEDTDNNQHSRVTSSITVMEVSG